MPKKLKEKVEYILKNFPDSRNSDQWLTLKIWGFFYGKVIDRTDPQNPKVALKDIMELPREDHVKRIRAHFQNDLNKYLPTSLEVVKQRRQNEERWREAMSSATEHTRI